MCAASKALGQHFLTSPAIARRIAYAAGLEGGDTVLEIGPGKGILTRELMRVAGRVVAVEKDEALAARLREKFSAEVASGALALYTADIRECDLGALGLAERGYTVVANIPYYLTGNLLRFLLENPVQPREMVLLVQKEVAEQIARARRESILSISVKAYGDPEYVAKVGRKNFNPPPAVDSAILAVRGISRDVFTTVAPEELFALVKTGFAHPRKLVIRNLEAIASHEALAKCFAELAISPDARAEELSVSHWRALAETLAHE